MDIYPTLLEMAQGKRAEQHPSLDGHSLLPLLQGSSQWPERGYFTAETGKPEQAQPEEGWTHRFTEHSLPLNQRSSCFVQGHWSIVNDKGHWGLFDLSKDPQQKKNLKSQWPEQFSIMKEAYFKEKSVVWSDPHAFSDPVQVIGYEGDQDSYIEMEGMYKGSGRYSVTWANTFFLEPETTQILKIEERQGQRYEVSLRALSVPKGTEVALNVVGQNLQGMLMPGQKYHVLGELEIPKGTTEWSLSLLKTSEPQKLRKMEVFSLHLRKLKGENLKK
jgi:hypothetical protein